MRPGALSDPAVPRAPTPARDALPSRAETRRPGPSEARPEADVAAPGSRPEPGATPRDDATAAGADAGGEGPRRQRSDGAEAFGETFDAALAELAGLPTPIAAAVAEAAQGAAVVPAAAAPQHAGATAAAVLSAAGAERVGQAAALAALGSQGTEGLARGEGGTEPGRALAAALAEQLEGGGERAPADAAADARPPAFAQLLAGRGPELASPREAPAFETPLAPRQPNFDHAVAERVRWLVEGGSESAELRLDPPQLGSLGVRVRIEGDQASLLFTSGQAAVREALEAAIPRLRELFAEAGLQLGDVDVGAGDGSAGGDAGTGSGEGAGGPGTPEDGPTTPLRRGGRGLLDAYA